MSDYYLEDKSRLKNQPKRTIADYVEQNGILVPRRFDSLKEARKSKKGILLRSEHEQEYDGISGLFNSFPLSNYHYEPSGKKSLKEIKEKYFYWSENDKGSFMAGTPLYKQWADRIGRPVDKIKEELKFSIWQNLSGLNRKVIADDSLKNRWYIMTEGRYSKDHYVASTIIFKDGEIEKESTIGKGLPFELVKKLPSLVETYEKIRNLSNFDPNHCPTMEFQYHNGKDYFLQYHRTRDFKEREFILDRVPTKNEIVLPFVRGSTKEEGEVCDVTVYYGLDKNFHYIWDTELEDGSWDLHYNHILSEIETRKRKLQMEHVRDNDVDWHLRGVCGNHDSFSKLFRPKVTGIIDINELFLPNENIEVFGGIREKRSSMILKVTSDGKKGYIERIN